MTDYNPPKPTLYERPFCVLDKDATVLGSDPFTYDFRAALENAGSSRESTRSTTYGYGRPTKAKTAKAHGLNDGELLELGLAGTTSDRVKALLGQGFVANEIANDS
jgi:hypothetical protein